MSAATLRDAATLSELARRLLADTDASIAAEYRQHFMDSLYVAKARLHAPLPPEDFAIASAVAESTELAIEVLSSVWTVMHS